MSDHDCNCNNNINPDPELFWTILVHIGNALSIIYNFPQIYLTCKTKKASDISYSFLWIRVGSSVIWIAYSIHYNLWLVIVSWIISLISSLIILYYKYAYKPSHFVEMIDEKT